MANPFMKKNIEHWEAFIAELKKNPIREITIEFAPSRTALCIHELPLIVSPKIGEFNHSYVFQDSTPNFFPKIRVALKNLIESQKFSVSDFEDAMKTIYNDNI